MAFAGSAAIPWNLSELSKPPRTYPAPGLHPMGPEAQFYERVLNTPELRAFDAGNNRVKCVFFEGLPFQGKHTRVFAYYGLPDLPKGQKAPGIVLVHGGGGTAFESWVRLWNARGYAAIAMDTCGCIPVGEYSKWNRHQNGGPPGWGGFNQIDSPIQDQWPYHAVADVILAHSLLRAMPEVDPERTGITGISWGGYLTCIASAVDTRFRFAAPVYGCGFLGDNSAWLDMFARMGKQRAEKWLELWDPSRFLRRSSVPMIWVTGTNDFAYPMDSLQKSYRLPKGPRTLCIRVRMPHGHGGIGETAPEIRAFADSHCLGVAPMVRIVRQGRSGFKAWVRTDGKRKIARAELNYTCDNGSWYEREWKTVQAESGPDGQVSARLPEGTTVYYFNLIDEDGLIVSSEHVEISQALP